MQKEPIRVAQIIGKMAAGGVEAVVYNYYRAINHSAVQFDFFVDDDSSAEFPRQLLDMGARVYPIPPYRKPLAYLSALIRSFRQNHYQIVHAHVNTMNVFPLFAAWWAKVPVRICHNHSTADWGEKKKTLLKYLLRPFAKVFATEYFACGEKAGRWMYGNHSFESGKVHVMTNAIDTGKFSFDLAARRRLREELSIGQDVFVVGHVGRFTYAKNHEFLLRIFQAVLLQCEDARLLLVGEGERMEYIRTEAQKLGLADKVCFTGSRADVNELYSVMDVFCLPSFYEGFGVVALESQANGLKCVLSDRVPSEADVTGTSAFLPLSAQPQKWAQELLAQQGSPRRDQSDEVKEAGYDIAQSAAELAAYYQSCLRR